MKLQIEQPHIENMIAAFPELSGLKDQLCFGNKVEVTFDQLTEAQLGFLSSLYRQGGADLQTRAAQIDTLKQVRNDGGKRFAEGELEDVLPALLEYLINNGSRGWLFSANTTTKPLPYVVTRLDYVPDSNDEAGKVFIELKANARGSISTQLIRITVSDIAEKTVGEILLSKGYVKETPVLLNTYDKALESYMEWRGQYGMQFSGQGTGFYVEDPSATHRNTDWLRKDVVVLTSGGSRARLVNDESILTSRSLTLESPGDVVGAYLRKASKSNSYDAEEEVGQLQASIPVGLFTQMPIHPYIFMFHLDLHHYLWVHVDDLEPYAYQPALKQKLVLPPEQTDLIDILTAEMDVLMDDIVAGKSGGTTVLCAGPAGVGKTLTAEVYAEIIKRPLYRVHSGQLGLDVAEMEVALKDVLTRAQRWGAVMLIDEADVYIRRRDDNMTANAVVGVFLRVLEYFNGLLFLTTNRVDDIDEAIVSRCIALIKYSPPDDGARRRIWQVMTQQFGLDVAAPLLDELVDMFPGATGRDIKGLSKLVSKYCSHKQAEPTAEVFKRCSIFRGMDLGQPA